MLDGIPRAGNVCNSGAISDICTMTKLTVFFAAKRTRCTFEARLACLCLLDIVTEIGQVKAREYRHKRAHHHKAAGQVGPSHLHVGFSRYTCTAVRVSTPTVR